LEALSEARMHPVDEESNHGTRNPITILQMESGEAGAPASPDVTVPGFYRNLISVIAGTLAAGKLRREIPIYFDQELRRTFWPNEDRVGIEPRV
jgi:hypothetical protein